MQGMGADVNQASQQMQVFLSPKQTVSVICASPLEQRKVLEYFP